MREYLRAAPDIQKALPIAKEDMLSHIDSESKIEKGIYAVKYIFAIMGSCLHGIFIGIKHDSHKK